MKIGLKATTCARGADILSVHREPSDKSPILFQRLRDDLLNVYYEVEGIDGPKFNPLWYRVWGGYVHSGYTQQVKVRLNPVVSKLGRKCASARSPFPIHAPTSTARPKPDAELPPVL